MTSSLLDRFHDRAKKFLRGPNAAHLFWFLVPILFMGACFGPRYVFSHQKNLQAWEIFDDKEMREHVGTSCSIDEKLQCSESWGTSGCSKTHWTTCTCVLLKDKKPIETW